MRVDDCVPMATNYSQVLRYQRLGRSCLLGFGRTSVSKRRLDDRALTIRRSLIAVERCKVWGYECKL